MRLQLICHDHCRGEALPLQQFPHKLGGGALVSSALYQQVEDFAFVIDGAPEIYRLATDPNHHLVEVPTETGARSTASQSLSEGGPELQHPAPDRLVEEIDATLGQEIPHVSVAQSEAQVNPDSVLDDDGRELRSVKTLPSVTPP
jgi:hypothetical protein